MGLSAMTVYQEQSKTRMMEELAYRAELFNGVTNGGLLLRAANHSGDYAERSLFARIDGLVRRRNAYGSGAVASKTWAQLTDRMVKVAAGTPPVEFTLTQFEWINSDPGLAATMYGVQLAEEMVVDMVGVAVTALIAALGQTTAINYDATGKGGSQGAGTGVTPSDFVRAAAKMGDRQSDIRCWVMHTNTATSLLTTALANAETLFTFENVGTIVRRDALGRVFVITDNPALYDASADTALDSDEYYVLGLMPGAALVDQNDDFTSNVETKNGFENILRTMQSEWSYNLGIKGYRWDSTNGGPSPSTGALTTAGNWDKWATSHKDLGGVLMKVADPDSFTG
jgi:hypothetical protein